MKILLDTHTFLWYITNDKKLSPVACDFIEDAENDSLISMASLWEIAIKSSLGKLKLKESFSTFIPVQLKINLVEVLPIKISHLSLVSILPLHHRDPFDRLIVAQSILEELPILSIDKQLDDYSITKLILHFFARYFS